MPYKKYYWQDPERYRCEKREYHARMMAKGFKGGESLATYLNDLARAVKWGQEHKLARCRAAAKYVAKIKKAVGSTGHRGRFLFKLMGGAKAFNKGEMLKIYTTSPIYYHDGDLVINARNRATKS